MGRLRVRTWMIAGVAVLVIAGASVYWFVVRDSSAAAAQSQTQTVAASLTTLEKSVTGTGTLTPGVQEDVSFASGGTVTSVLVAAGDTVTAGQTLATIDTLSLDADVLAARATLAKAQATLSNNSDDADGTDASDAQIASSTKQVELAQSQVTSAEDKLAGATLIAPVDGILTSVDLAVGDVVGGSGSSSGGAGSGSVSASAGGATTATTSSASSAQFTIVGTTSWTVPVTVDESDIASLTVGDQAELTVDNLSSTVFGTVTEIGLISTSTRGVAGYPVTITVTGDPDGLNDGVSADVSIIYERRTDVLTVPTAAVRQVDGASVVDKVAADGTQVVTTVTIGETSGSSVEITDGLAEGDEVLVTIVAQSTGQTGRSGQDTQTGQFPSGGTMPDGANFPGGPAMPGGQGGPNGG
ncbi:efflux RND transporter periplasmic adaptor subunit [Sanguibacter gelidistatuariae]|nr:HlyD family efflux transporter periplasmic adaptor subunit [Sanguibacter gelidistatuariae]